MQSQWETYKGKKIFFTNYVNLGTEQLRQEIAYVTSEILKQPENSVLALVDTHNTIITPEALDMLKDVAVKSKKHVIKTAVSGVTGVRRTMLDAIIRISGMKIEAFNTLEEAKDWLVSD